MSAAQPWAGLVAVRGGEIAFVGESRDLGRVAGPGTRVIDCQGGVLLPGFIDAHMHLFSLVRALLGVDLAPPAVSSIEDIKSVIRRAAEKSPPGAWLTGAGYHEFYLAEHRSPNRRDLDEAAPENPVILCHRGLHACVLNSRALALAGITGETPDPPDGLIDRDLITGEPNGILYEMLGYIREKVMPPLSRDDYDRGLARANERLLAYGVTSFHDASVTNDFVRWRSFARSREEGRLKSRVYMMLAPGAAAQFREQGMATGSGDDGLRLGGVKIMLSEATGQVRPAGPELCALSTDLDRAGFQLAFHAVQRNTVQAAVRALEYIGRNVSARRHRIEHCSECPPGLLARLERLRPVVVTQPPFLYYSGDRYLAMVPPEEHPWLYRFRSLMAAGLVVGGSSDSPVVPGNPLYGVYAAVTRQTEAGWPLLPHEAVDIGQALAMYTVNAAYAASEEKRKGSIAPGKLADFVLLDGDPMKSPPEQIKELKVLMTVIGGRVVREG